MLKKWIYWMKTAENGFLWIRKGGDKRIFSQTPRLTNVDCIDSPLRFHIATTTIAVCVCACFYYIVSWNLNILICVHVCTYLKLSHHLCIASCMWLRLLNGFFGCYCCTYIFWVRCHLRISLPKWNRYLSRNDVASNVYINHMVFHRFTVLHWLW